MKHNPGGLGATTPYIHRTKAFPGEKSTSRAAASAEAGPSNPTRAQLAAFGSRKTAQNQVHEVDDEDDEDDIQEVEAKTMLKGHGKQKETHGMEDEDDDEIQEVDPPPRMTKSRGGSRKPSSTVNEKPSINGAAVAATKGKRKARVKPKIGPPRSVPKFAREPMDVDSNDAVEHEMDVDINGAATVTNAINAAMKNNAGRVPKMQSGQQKDDRTIVRLEESLRQVRFTLIRQL